MKKIKNYLTVTLAAIFIFGMFIWGIIAPDKEVSVSERRSLASFPQLTYDSIYSGRFMTDFETYSLEQFPLRDTFRSVKAYTAINALGMKDNNGIFIKEGHIFKTEYPLNYKSVSRAVGIFREIHDTYLTDENNVYISVIPDKNFYLSEKNEQLVIDYAKLFSAVENQAEFARYINISSLLNLNDYYRTDSHWRQENITDVAELLLSSMGADSSKTKYSKIKTETPFYGVYYGQAAVDTEPDTLYYLTNSAIKNAKVYDFESDKYISVYDSEKISGNDPYEIFLSGAKSLITIENEEAVTDRELVIFRDSFGSSIAPLMIESYKKITLVDIRYLPSSAVGRYIEFNNQDVLFLYSTSVLNNSATLK